MIGHPKFRCGQTVSFKTYQGNTITGQIIVVDLYGVFEDNTDVHYDISTDDTIYKHVKETFIFNK